MAKVLDFADAAIMRIGKPMSKYSLILSISEWFFTLINPEYTRGNGLSLCKKIGVKCRLEIGSLLVTAHYPVLITPIGANLNHEQH
jgi:hypothetical protein